MEIFEESKGFPPEEKLSLTDQIRRSSLSVSSNISEAWSKKNYEKYEEVRKMLISMINNPQKFCK